MLPQSTSRLTPIIGRLGRHRGLVLAVLLNSALAGIMSPTVSGDLSTPLFVPAWRGDWIGTQDQDQPQAHFRHEFYVNGKVTNAWIRVAADNEFSLFLNGKNVGRNRHLDTNLSEFQIGVSESGQHVGTSWRYRLPTNPNMQWAAQNEWRFAYLLDIGPVLTSGRNVIAAFAQSNRQRPRLRLDGEILLEDGTRIALASDESWKADNLAAPNGGRIWVKDAYPDQAWQPAQRLSSEGRLGDSLSAVDPRMFTEPLDHNGLSARTPGRTELFLRRRLTLPSMPRHAWLRLYSESTYDLFVNGYLVGLGRTLHGIHHRQRVFMLDIRALLDVGENVIAIRLARPPAFERGHDTATLRVDGLLRFKDGRERWLNSADPWRSAERPEPDWTQVRFDDRRWEPPAVVPWGQADEAKVFNGREVDWSGVLRSQLLAGAMALGGLTLTAWLPLALLRRKLGAHARLRTLPLEMGMWTSALLLGSAVVLDHRFRTTETGILFDTPGPWWIVSACALLVVGVGLVVCWLVNTGRPLRRLGATGGRLVDRLIRWDAVGRDSTPRVRRSEWLIVAILLTINAYLTFHRLGFEWLQNDELVSLSTALGILKSGLPQYDSGVLYTRSPFYHYLLAGFLYLFGTSAEVARLPSAMMGVVVTAFAFKFARDLSGRRLVAMAVLLFMAISPWNIYVARAVRYYPFMQFFALAAIYYFIKGFIHANVPRYQNRFFVCYILAFLSQEVTIVLIPPFLIGILLFAKPLSWRENRNILWGVFAFLLVAAVDLISFQVVTLTNIAGVSAGTGSVIRPHLADVGGFLTIFFVGQQRSSIPFTVWFLIGIPLWVKRRDPVLAYLYLLVFLTLMAATALVIQVRLRYVFSLYPILLFITCYSVVEVCLPTPPTAALSRLSPVPKPRLVPALWVVVIFAAFIWSYQPVRLWNSYQTRINAGEADAWRYAAEHRREGEILITAHPQAAMVFSQRADYFMPPLVSFDEVFRRNGVMIDRWSGGQLIDSLDKLRSVLARNERVWIVVSDRRMKYYAKDLRDFIEQNLRPVYRPFSAAAWLWDKSNGLFSMPPYEHEENTLY